MTDFRYAFDRRTAGDARCEPERRISQQIERLCGARELHAADAVGAHRCYECQGHDGPHRCACNHEWTG